MAVHFGHCPVFTVLTIDGGQVVETEIVDNAPHLQGGCQAPVNTLVSSRVTDLIVGNIGMRPLVGFQAAGVRVVTYPFQPGSKVADAVQLFLSGAAQAVTPDKACGGASRAV